MSHDVTLEHFLAAREALGEEEADSGVASRPTKPGDVFEAIEMGQAVEQLGRGAGRERNSRFVEVDGDLVLKINNYSLEVRLRLRVRVRARARARARVG